MGSMHMAPDMARAVVEGRKRQTRRLTFKGEVGDRLWMRERAEVVDLRRGRGPGRVMEVQLVYAADGARSGWVEWPARMVWEPERGYFVPNGVHREGARRVLVVTEVREELLREISERDAAEEGTPLARVQSWRADALGPILAGFASYWDNIAPEGKRWSDNPRVKVVKFDVEMLG